MMSSIGSEMIFFYHRGEKVYQIEKSQIGDLLPAFNFSPLSLTYCLSRFVINSFFSTQSVISFFALCDNHGIEIEPQNSVEIYCLSCLFLNEKIKKLAEDQIISGGIPFISAALNFCSQNNFDSTPFKRYISLNLNNYLNFFEAYPFPVVNELLFIDHKKIPSQQLMEYILKQPIQNIMQLLKYVNMSECSHESITQLYEIINNSEFHNPLYSFALKEHIELNILQKRVAEVEADTTIFANTIVQVAEGKVGECLIEASNLIDKGKYIPRDDLISFSIFKKAIERLDDSSIVDLTYHILDKQGRIEKCITTLIERNLIVGFECLINFKNNVPDKFFSEFFNIGLSKEDAFCAFYAKHHGIDNRIFDKKYMAQNEIINPDWKIIPSCICLNFPKLKNLIIPLDVEIIKYGCFAGCTELKSVIIPSSVKMIFPAAFLGCINLKYVYILSEKTEIDVTSFEQCQRAIFYVGPSQTQMDIHFLIQKKYGVYIVPFGSKKIEQNQFKGRNDLKTIIIPWTVKTVEDGSFSNCQNLENVYMFTSTQVEKNAFENCQHQFENHCYWRKSLNFDKDSFWCWFYDWNGIDILNEFFQRRACDNILYFCVECEAFQTIQNKFIRDYQYHQIIHCFIQKKSFYFINISQKKTEKAQSGPEFIKPTLDEFKPILISDMGIKFLRSEEKKKNIIKEKRKCIRQDWQIKFDFIDENFKDENV